MSNLKKLSFCFIVLFLLCLSINSFAADNDGCLDCPTIPDDIPSYFLRWEILPATIDPGTIEQDSAELVVVAGKLPPFSWSVGGTGFSLQYSEGATNTLYAGPNACGVAEITVKDRYGISIIGEVRCSNGRWGERIEGCIMPGEESNGSRGLIKGKYRQTQEVYNLSDWYPHWAECPLDICDEQCATSRYCDPDYGCEPCLNRSLCKNAGYAGTECPPICRAWCYCTTELYYQEWICPDNGIGVKP